MLVLMLGASADSLPMATVSALAAIPGLVHGFERRGPLGEPETREAARQRLTGALAAQGRLLLLKQVHGCAVRTAPWEGRPEADASVAANAGLLLGIETADCLPVLIVDPRHRTVAAAHAGWRGTAAGVTRAAVEALSARGSAPADLLAALGPGIGPCCYEVGEAEAGVPAGRIQDVDECTFCRPDLYHSFRRDGKGAGRMVSFIGFRA
jgi:copper oxidase (laccase) domain-containing protein